MATQDLNILEGLQYAANFMLLNDNAIVQEAGQRPSCTANIAARLGLRHAVQGMVRDEGRGVSRPAAAFLHPSSYFQTLIDQSADYYLSR
jgi:hypothetical protein